MGALTEKPFDVPLLFQTMKELLAEPPEAHLKRLAGLHSYVRYVHPPHTMQPSAKTREQRNNP